MGGAPESVSSSDAERALRRVPGRRAGSSAPPIWSSRSACCRTTTASWATRWWRSGMLRPLDVFRLLSEQVRDRVIDVFALDRRDVRVLPRRHQPPGELPARPRHVRDPGGRRGEHAGRACSSSAFEPLATSARRHRPRARRAGGVQDRTDAARGAATCSTASARVRAWLDQFGDPDERLTFLRSLYLLVETDLAELD